MRQVTYPRPGEILLEEFLKPMGISVYSFAREIGISHQCVQEIVAGGRPITSNTGPRLSCYFGISENFWIGLQSDFDAAK